MALVPVCPQPPRSLIVTATSICNQRRALDYISDFAESLI
jgi:hypothetical protein